MVLLIWTLSNTNEYYGKTNEYDGEKYHKGSGGNYGDKGSGGKG